MKQIMASTNKLLNTRKEPTLRELEEKSLL